MGIDERSTRVLSIVEARNESNLQGLGDLAYPWLPRENPAAMQAEDAATRWVLEQGLLTDDRTAKRYHAVSVGRLAAMTHPEASPEILALISQVMAWIFVQDDIYDTAPAHEQRPELLEAKFARYLHVLRTRRAPADAGPTTRALVDLARRLHARGSERWYAHFIETMRRFWIDGIVVETYYRARGISPDPASYMAMREQTVGVYICLDLVELASGCELTEELRADPILRRMTWLTSRIIAYVNDVFSYEKEREAGDMNNFLQVTLRYESYDLAEVVDHVVRTHDRELDQFCQLDGTTRDHGPWARRIVERYVEGCRSWMTGALAWQQVAGRYASGRALLGEQAKPRLAVNDR
ncbi:MAG: hypothetical protein K0V04_34930 [Deltaproteobacteria bacterium]|nr:hypothetical protein [Deltaproteobacteria bacterium]